MADNELSVEETNKIRLSLGLKPLKVDSGPTLDSAGKETFDDTTDGRERLAVDNWKKHEEAAEKEAARKRHADDIKKARDAAHRFRALEGKGLVDDDDEEMGEGKTEDATTWVKKMKKRQKKLAEKMAQEKEEELERAAKELKEYTAADLQGVKVGHDIDDFGELGGDTILTLKDATIDEMEEEGDELVSTDLAERERLSEKLDLKKKRPAYNPFEEVDPTTGERTLLSQYDDEEEKERRKKRFVLDGSGSLATNETYRQEVAEKLKAQVISLDLPKPEAVSDYVDPSKTKIRKPKKPKKKSTRKRSEDDEDSLNPAAAEAPPAPDASAMELDDAPIRSAPKKRQAEDISFIDDDDLQAALALQRRTALKKRKILKPADIARQFQAEEAASASATPAPAEDPEETGLVIDETSEFVATLRAPTIEPRKPTQQPTTPAAPASPQPADADAEDGADAEADIDMIRDERTTPPPPTGPPAITSTGLDEEATISRGVGATLAMLNQRGLLKRDPDAEAKAALTRDRDRFRLQKKLSTVEAEEKAKLARLRDRQSGKFERMSAREREEHARWENKQRDVQEARDMANRFKDYKPDVELHYKDEHGREMNQKEAFKYLSHQFHGKGSGKAKTEKRLKKIEDEKKREAASNLSVGGEDAVRDAARKSKQAGVRLM